MNAATNFINALRTLIGYTSLNSSTTVLVTEDNDYGVLRIAFPECGKVTEPKGHIMTIGELEEIMVSQVQNEHGGYDTESVDFESVLTQDEDATVIIPSILAVA